MKKIALFAFVFPMWCATIAATAEAVVPNGGIRVALGYRSVHLDAHEYSHDTHPGDSFLPNANVPGSAGTTEVGGSLHFFTLSAGYQSPFREKWLLASDVGIMGGGERDCHQNSNDDRPASSGAFVYSQARFGLFAATGLSYRLARFRLGIEGQLAGVFVDSGWYRYANDDSEHTEFVLVPSMGPQFVYRCGEMFNVEATVQVGDSVAFGVRVVQKF